MTVTPWIAVAVVIAIFLTAAPSRGELPGNYYLFTSFRDNGQDGLHLAYSTDGYHFTALKNDKSFLKPQVGKEKLMRDPCITIGRDGTYHMVWTDSWTDRTIGYAHSKDLITWSEQKAIPVMMHEPTARNCWAPEIVYDETKKHFLIFWATTIPDRFAQTDGSSETKYNHRIYSTTTTDFETFTPTKLYFDPGFNVIDSTLFLDGNRVLMFFKDETLKPVKKYLQFAEASSVDGPFKNISEPISSSWVEGPTVARVGEHVVVYFDCYRDHHYGAVRTKDFKTWEDVTNKVEFPKGTRHGTILPVSKSVIETLMK